MHIDDPEKMTCARCGKPIDEEREEFAALYGPTEDPIEIVGYLHMKCSEELEAMGTIQKDSLH